MLGLGHSSLVDAGLLLATVLRPTKCSSCLGSWMQLAANLQAFSMTISSSMLLQPCTATGSDTLVMQVSKIGFVITTLPYWHSMAWPCIRQRASASSLPAQLYTIISILAPALTADQAKLCRLLHVPAEH